MLDTGKQCFKSCRKFRILAEKIQLENQLVQVLKAEISKVIVGQTAMIDRLLIALLANGHVFWRVFLD
jgi:hypothetical protein